MSSSRWLDVSVPLVSDMARAFAYSSPRFDPVTVGTQPDGQPVTALHIDMYSHVGTHIESARHIFEQGATLESYPPGHFVGPGQALDLAGVGSACIEASHLESVAADIEADSFVLLRLGREQLTSSDHPYLSPEAARWLVDRRVRVVGVDTPTPDMDVRRRGHPLDLPVHRVLLEAGVLIIENLSEQLRDACGRVLTVHAWPLSIPGSDSSPVRVVLHLDS